jgi:hypothetical protein
MTTDREKPLIVNSGTYNDAFQANLQAECTACPAEDHTSTFQTGGLSKADCNVCKVSGEEET